MKRMGDGLLSLFATMDRELKMDSSYPSLQINLRSN
jgi:hypothetical protein